MKIYFLLILFIGTSLNVQEPILPLNEKGKVAFEEEVVVKNLGKDALLVNALNFFSRVKKASDRKPEKARVEKDAILKEGSFFVYTKGLLTPQVHGEIKYTLKVEVKENTYKYTYTDFIFQFYEKNRYGQFAPVSGKYKPLEEEKFAGMQKTWQSHKEITKEAIQKHISELKKKMEEVPPGARINEENHFEESY